MELHQHPLRVAVFSLDEDPSLIYPAHRQQYDIELFQQPDSHTPQHILRRTAAKALVGSLQYHLTDTQSLASLESAEDEMEQVYDGYALRTTAPVHQPQRNFDVRHIALPRLADYVDERPDMFDPVDRLFLRKAMTVPLVMASLQRASHQVHTLER